MVKDGRLVVAKGYGWANVATQEPVTPRTLFSLASVSKPIGAIAILRLVDQGRLRLDDRVYDVLGRPAPLGGSEIVPRARQITIRDILNHSAGWLRPHDPLAHMNAIARELNLSKPVPSDAIVRYAFSHPLDFTPGSQQSYSNFSYQILRHVCQSVTKQTFESYVRQEVLLPLGITDMRLEQIGPGYAGRSPSLSDRRPARIRRRPGGDQRRGAAGWLRRSTWPASWRPSMAARAVRSSRDRR